MYAQVIPTWLVYVARPQQDREKFRVPESDIDAFTRVLLFNRLGFEVMREETTQYVFNGGGSAAPADLCEHLQPWSVCAICIGRRTAK